MRIAAVAFTLFFPAAAQAADLVYTCTGTGPAEANAVLRKLDGQDKGSITVDGTETAAEVYPGLGSVFFLVVGDGFTLTYTVATDDGEMHYSGTGSRKGFAKGSCTAG